MNDETIDDQLADQRVPRWYSRGERLTLRYAAIRARCTSADYGGTEFFKLRTRITADFIGAGFDRILARRGWVARFGRRWAF